jgi:hypothetical protein
MWLHNSNEHFIYHENEDAPSSISEADYYVIIIDLLDYIFKILPVLIHRWEIHVLTWRFYCIRTVPWFLVQMDFKRSQHKYFQKNLNLFHLSPPL